MGGQPMETDDLGELVRAATCDVCSTMLDLELEAVTPYQNPHPLAQGEVTALIGIAGDQQGFVSVHCTRSQAQQLTARLLGEADPITDSDAILDAMGELVNMVAGNVKSGYAERGTLQISLPTVVMTPKSEIRVKASYSVVVDFEGPIGRFCVEVMLAQPGV